MTIVYGKTGESFLTAPPATNDEVQVSLSTSSAKTAAALGPGLYVVWASAAANFKAGPQASITVTTSTGRAIPSGVEVLVGLTTSSGIAGIVASGAATLHIYKLGAY
jgi:hypothetical protein